MANTIKIKRGQSANLKNLSLEEGELAVTLDTKELYVGDGTDKPAKITDTELQQTVNNLTQKVEDLENAEAPESIKNLKDADNDSLYQSSCEASYDIEGETVNIGAKSIELGNGTVASGNNALSAGTETWAAGENSVAFGKDSYAAGKSAMAMGDTVIAVGNTAFAEGYNTQAISNISHAEGAFTTAGVDGTTGIYTHAEGYSTEATGDCGHSEGRNTKASGGNTHAEGQDTVASGTGSHAENNGTIASGMYSHAEGTDTVSSGENSHAEGWKTIAKGSEQHVQGKWNVEDTDNKYAHILGIGKNNARANGHTVDWDGNGWFKGTVTVGGTSQDDGEELSTKTYVDESISDLVTKDELEQALKTISSFSWEEVDSLESIEKPKSNVIYLVKRTETDSESDEESNETPEVVDIHDEYIYVNDKFEYIGTLQMDLSDYYTKEEVTTQINDAIKAIPTMGINVLNGGNHYVENLKDGVYFCQSDTKLKYDDGMGWIEKQFRKGSTIIVQSPQAFVFEPFNDAITRATYGGFTTKTFSNLLTTDNVKAFTPTDDYNPTSKKYVDDVIAGLDDGKIKLYEKGTKFEKDSLIYYENAIYRVIQDFVSDNTEDYSISESIEADIMAGNLLYLNKEAEHIIKPYEQNKLYEAGMLVYASRTIARVVSDYISDSTEADVESSINLDVANGHLIEMGDDYRFKLYHTTQDLEKTIGNINTIPVDAIQFENGEDIDNMRVNDAVYGPLGTIGIITEIDRNNRVIKAKSITARDTDIMPQAPDFCDFQIVLDGTGYSVGDIIATSDSDVLVKVTGVGNDGNILSVERSYDRIMPTSGSGASIVATKILYGGNAKGWYEIELSNSAKLIPYAQNKNYEKDNLIYFGSYIYYATKDFTSNGTEISENASLDSDIMNGYLVAIEGKLPPIPICLGDIPNEDSFPTQDVVEGNWVVITDCNLSAPGQAGIGIKNGNGWDIIPIPQGEMQFPEPLADGGNYFRSVAQGDTKGSWVKFTEVDGNNYKILINNKTENNDGNEIPAANELVWFTKVNDETGEVTHDLLMGDGVKTLSQLEPFYSQAYNRDDIIGLIGFEPEDSSKKGQANGYAPLDADGKVPEANLPDNLIDAYSKSETDKLIDDLNTNLTTNINTEASRATKVEDDLRKDLDDHVADNSIHVTQDEKDEWSAKVDKTDLTDYDNHISDTAIHVTQADKDKWNGMQQAYFVTDEKDLPTAAEIGNIGYVQTSAPGVTPIVCDQYLWDGTEWKLLDSEGVSISFKWDNLIGKPAATPLTIDNVVTIAHNHTNKNVLDKVGQTSAGAFTFDGVEIGIKALFFENDALLPEVGALDTLYVIYADSRTRQYPSISVYKDGAYQILGKGAQENAPVVGDMQILQAEYYSVKANSSYTINYSTPNQYFCFLPVEILKEIAGATNQTHTLLTFNDPNNFTYNENFLDINSTGFCTIGKKELKTTIETVSDNYISYVDVDIDDYKDIEGIS